MVLFSSSRHDWRTPKKIYDDLNQEFDFDFDPCPPDADFDGLEINWKEKNFVNPPFKSWQAWVRKSYEQALQGKLVVLLIAARTDTIAFHETILRYATEIRFIKGRLKFEGAKGPAPFPSMIVIFN